MQQAFLNIPEDTWNVIFLVIRYVVVALILECDAVLHRRNGTYGLIEIKLGGEGLIEEGAANLKSLAEKIDTARMKAPSFMMVLTGTGAYAYRRKDGPYEPLQDCDVLSVQP